MSDILAEMERLLLVTMFGSSIEECWLSSDLILNIFPSDLIQENYLSLNHILNPP